MQAVVTELPPGLDHLGEKHAPIDGDDLQQLFASMMRQITHCADSAQVRGFADSSGFKVGSLAINASPTSASTSAGRSPGSLTPPATSSERCNSEGLARNGIQSGSSFPVLPSFPFPQTTTVPAKAWSLADALGLDSHGPTQHVHAEDYLPQVLAPPVLPLFPAMQTFNTFLPARGFEGVEALLSPIIGLGAESSDDTDAFVFSITIHKAGGTALGLLTTAIGKENGVLRIDGVQPGGAAEAWNRQCWGSGAAEKVLLPGDTVVSVNDVGEDSAAMMVECDTQSLLRFMVVRNSLQPTPRMPVVGLPGKFTSFRAEAPEFVPPADAVYPKLANESAVIEHCNFSSPSIC